MSLSTITDKDFRPRKVLFNKPEFSSLQTADIDGAQPKLKGYEYTNKPSLWPSNDSPSPPRSFEPRVPNSLVTHDIEKATPARPHMKTTRFGHNPLVPVYKLSEVERRPATPPKFVRDAMNVSDIAGASPATLHKWAPRDSFNVRDIEGARAKPEKARMRSDFMDPRDINRGDSTEFTRSTNPLMPEYQVRDEDGTLITIGEVERSKPKTWLPPYQAHSRHLTTQDIEGAKTNTVGKGAFFSVERKNFREMTTSDIAGAQASTLKKGISTFRVTNPVDPQYKWTTEEVPKPTSPVADKSKSVNSLCNESTSAHTPPPELRQRDSPKSASSMHSDPSILARSRGSSANRYAAQQLLKQPSNNQEHTPYKFKLARSEVQHPTQSRCRSSSRSTKLMSSAKSLF